jgi:hypothetical protein
MIDEKCKLPKELKEPEFWRPSNHENIGNPAPTGSTRIKDSGTRTEFDTGAVRDGREDKGRFDLLPPMTLFRLAKHFDAGCQKYGDRNWEKGIPLSKYFDSAFRHMQKHLMGFTDENHMTATLWNIACYIETYDRIKLGILPPHLDDMPNAFAGVAYESFEKLLSEGI